MKVFSVSKACNACGECVLRTSLLTEDEGGFAIPTPGQYIRESDLPEAELVAAQCPVNALTVVEENSVTSKGIAGLKELTGVLKQRLEHVAIPSVSRKDIAYNAKDYKISHGRIDDEDQPEYRSSRQAKEAGESQFEAVFWDQRHDFVASVLTQYKSKVLRKYYDLRKPKQTVYAEIDQQVVRILEDIVAEASSLMGEPLLLPNDFTTFQPERKSKDFKDYLKQQYDEYLVSPSYITDFCERFEETDMHRKRDYEDRIYAREHVEVIGKDWLGNNKIKTTYCFKNANTVGKDLVKDIIHYLEHPSDCGLFAIDQIARDNLRYCLKRYQALVKEEIEKKIKTFEDAVRRMESGEKTTQPTN